MENNTFTVRLWRQLWFSVVDDDVLVKTLYIEKVKKIYFTNVKDFLCPLLKHELWFYKKSLTMATPVCVTSKPKATSNLN